MLKYIVLIFFCVSLVASNYDSSSSGEKHRKKHHYKKKRVGFGSFENNVIVCENVLDKTISCDGDNEVIKVLSAVYGRTDQNACPSPIDWDVKTSFICASTTSTYYYQAECNGKTQCNIGYQVTDDFKLDNNIYAGSTDLLCGKNFNYLNMTYTCIKPLVICDEAKHELSCHKNEAITIVSAFYGRKDSHTCPHRGLHSESSSDEKFNCQSQYSTSAVQALCNGKSKCHVRSSPRSLGIKDPCRHVPKYLEIAYTCSASTLLCLNKIKDDGTVEMGNNKKVYFGCPAGQALTIYNAVGGSSLSYKDICPGVTTTSYSTQTCDLKDILQSACNSKNNCEITENDFNNAGKPCASKKINYVIVQYTCSLPFPSH